ncbi:MAG: choice-of-anchor D domain-containing protein, partial [Candidatus Sulfotelmatobacter sp.]
LSSTCMNPIKGSLTLIRPLTPGEISGLQVDSAITADAAQETIQYSCDSDLTSEKPNFQISADGCSGTLLTPQSSCSLQITFVPQPSTSLVSGLDYFVELNTLQCSSSVTSNCEIDSGRFPVELKANSASPLRMTPAAGLAFGTVPAGETGSPLTVTLFNDPKDPNAGTVNFTGSILQGSAFAETDNCAGSLAPGGSCTFTVTFTPLKGGYVYTSGAITIGLTVGQNPPMTQIIYLRGTGE